MKRTRRFLAGAFVLAKFTGGPSVHAAAAGPSPASPLDAALEQRASGKASLDDVEIEASWQLEEDNRAVNRAVHIWGSGVGIWEKSVQFRLSRAQVTEVIRMLVEARVGTIPQPGARPKPPAPAPKAPIQLRGELIVIAGDQRISRQQITKGEQSEALGALVKRLLDFSQKAAAGGVRASSLQDGLAKVGDGTLAPQALTASVRRQASAGAGAAGGDSFLLRLEGRQVTDRLMPKGQRPPPPRALTLSDADLRALALRLREADPASLAPTTYAPSYTDVTVGVLDYEKNVPARPYLDVTAETHGAKQKAFDRMYALFRDLHERVQKEGTATRAEAPSAGSSGAPLPSTTPASPAKP
jgi:hypothetical protein